ncbi:MAG: hypothetical protein GWM92_14740 [Gemmatimonadetes bacterium]|nr:hypothetical protein [Gemmatimonadota bacterium]NIR80002.1 hypothetical protein [Gemmatimonadota bacterium]NIT88737.1 hypothetical protein [Gemmatimonadota bacterium]NIU32547.1 hypothetical protein [Gemmatimonadota bacterium]NIU37010.1 hypothetical protein [Gemmatimonadota bacterium]
MKRTTHDLRRVAAAVLILPLVLVPAACGESRADGAGRVDAPIDRETFIATYLDLRLAALRNPEREITPQERARVLREHGVSEDELVGFVDAHSHQVSFMEEVWSEIESRLDSLRTPGDTASS